MYVCVNIYVSYSALTEANAKKASTRQTVQEITQQ